jgi:iron complex transport system ATP-binding protein
MNAQHFSGTLQLDLLTCHLGKRQVLKALSLPPLHAGQLIALVGPNGSGKSTLLRAMAGLIPAQIGAFTLGDANLQSLPAAQWHQHIRYLPQALPGPVHLAVAEALMVAIKLGKLADRREAELLQAINNTLETLNIDHLANRYLDELSGGQQQLVAIAQTLIQSPEVLLLDEPLAFLDLNYQHHVLHLLQTLCCQHGMLIIVVMHDLNLALAHAKHVLVLQEGALAASGSPVTTLSSDLLQNVFAVQGFVAQHPGLPPYLVVQRPLPLNPQVA